MTEGKTLMMSDEAIDGGGALPIACGPPIPKAAQPATLESLIEAMGPLAKTWCEHQRDMQRRQLDFEVKALTVAVAENRAILIAGTVIALVVLGLATSLFYAGRDAAAVQLVTLLTAVGGGGGIGFGLATRRKQQRTEEVK